MSNSGILKATERCESSISQHKTRNVVRSFFDMLGGLLKTLLRISPSNLTKATKGRRDFLWKQATALLRSNWSMAPSLVTGFVGFGTCWAAAIKAVLLACPNDPIEPLCADHFNIWFKKNKWAAESSCRHFVLCNTVAESVHQPKQLAKSTEGERERDRLEYNTLWQNRTTTALFPSLRGTQLKLPLLRALTQVNIVDAEFFTWNVSSNSQIMRNYANQTFWSHSFAGECSVPSCIWAQVRIRIKFSSLFQACWPCTTIKLTQHLWRLKRPAVASRCCVHKSDNLQVGNENIESQQITWAAKVQLGKQEWLKRARKGHSTRPPSALKQLVSRMPSRLALGKKWQESENKGSNQNYETEKAETPIWNLHKQHKFDCSNGWFEVAQGETCWRLSYTRDAYGNTDSIKLQRVQMSCEWECSVWWDSPPSVCSLFNPNQSRKGSRDGSAVQLSTTEPWLD